MLHFAEVREQVSRHLHELLEAILQRSGIEHPQVALPDTLDLLLDQPFLPLEFLDPLRRVLLGPRIDLS